MPSLRVAVLRAMPHRLARLATVCYLCQLPPLALHQALVRFAALPGDWGTTEAESVLACSFFAVYSALFAALGFASSKDFPVWWRATLTGWTTACGLHLSFDPALARLAPFGWYLTFLAFFHWSEYVATAATNPANLSTDSFLLNHSPAYHAAALLSWFEYFLELHFVPVVKIR